MFQDMDFLLQGDLDGDGTDESVALLWTSTGGSGTFDYLAALDRAADGSVVNRATAALGDRVRLRGAGIEDGRIVLDLVQAGPDDAACCPGEKIRRTYQLEGESLAERGAEQQGRLSLADLAGEWQLTYFARGEAARASTSPWRSMATGSAAAAAATVTAAASLPVRRRGRCPWSSRWLQPAWPVRNR